MNKRALLAAIATTTLTMTALLIAAPAEAAGEEGCSITDILPERAVIGVGGKRVPFDVPTDCPDEDVKFAVRGELVGTSAHVAWFAACNYDMDEGPSEYDCENDGSGIINPVGGRTQGVDYIEGNDIAGENNIYAYAFVDANHNGKDDDEPSCDIEECYGNPTDRDQDAGVIELLRQTRWAGTFNASPEPRRKGQTLNLSALLWTANWNTGEWDNRTASVKIQFRGVGEKTYRSVKSATARRGELRFATKAVRSGYWRVWYPGNDQIAGSYSNADYVKVNPAKRSADTLVTPTAKPTIRPTTPAPVPTTPAPTTTTAEPTSPPTAPQTTTAAPVDPTTSAPAARSYDNCDALHADYAHGVRRADGHDSGVADSLIPVQPTVYAANTRLDRDNDGVACEA